MWHHDTYRGFGSAVPPAPKSRSQRLLALGRSVLARKPRPPRLRARRRIAPNRVDAPKRVWQRKRRLLAGHRLTINGPAKPRGPGQLSRPSSKILCPRGSSHVSRPAVPPKRHRLDFAHRLEKFARTPRWFPATNSAPALPAW